MKRLMIRSLLACGLVLVGSSFLRADELPTAESILDKEAAAVGGTEAAEKVKTVVVKAKASVGDMTVTMLQQLAPERYRMEIIVEGVQKLEYVVSGNAAWKNSSITGAEVLQGTERSEWVRRASEAARGGNWRKKYKDAKCVAEETIEGKAAYKVELTTQDGKTEIHHYDKDSGLLLRTEHAEETPEGRVNEIESYSDYRKVDGIMYPFTARIHGGPAEIVMTIEEIKHNVDFPEGTFAPPAELKKQLEQK